MATPSLEQIESLLSEEAIEGLRASPGFRGACERAAAAGVAHFQAQDPTYRWITKDLGRTSICLTALILYATAAGLTAQSLVAACVGADVASSGRVLQVIRKCEAVGEFVVEDGPGLWTRRQISLGRGLLESLRGRARLELEAARPMAPETPSILGRFDEDGFFTRYALYVGGFRTGRELMGVFTSRSPTHIFLEREAGMLMLMDLMGGQSPDRARLLEAAPLSRYALSHRYGVSRAHINKLLADAVGARLLTCPATDRVAFSAALSDGLERQYAVIFQLSRAAGLAALGEVGINADAL